MLAAFFLSELLIVSFLLFRSGLEQEDMRIMYRYLITGLFPSYLEQNLQTENMSPVRLSGATTGSQIHYGK